MTVLSRSAILREMKKGTIKVSPFSESNIGPASIDLTLDNQFRIPKRRKAIVITNEIHGEQYAHLKKSSRIVLKPGELALGITKETVTLSQGFCGWLQGRSRFARLGLMVHVSSSFVHPGVSNKQVLEMVNVGKSPLVITPGLKICQLILQRAEGKGQYKGRFQRQKTP